MKRGCGEKNALIDRVTLTFDLSTPKTISLVEYFMVIPL